MIYHIMDRQFNPLTIIDTEASEGIVVENDIHTIGLTNGILLNELAMDISKNTGLRISDTDPNAQYETALIREGVYIVFVNDFGENVCLYVRSLDNEDEETRPISAIDIGTELRNGSATIFESQKAQHISYYVNRELYDTGWQIGVNEIGTDIKRMVDTSVDETPLARLQSICAAFNCEMTFTVEMQNTRVTKKLLNIYYSIGAKDTNRVLYSGVDLITLQKSVDIDNVITAIEDVNHGFNNLGTGDGRFLTMVGESIVYDREANALYGRGNTFDERFTGYITGRYASTGSTPIDCYNELRAILEERSQPTFSAEVELLFQDGEFAVGDYLTFVDEDYNPALRLKARVLSKEIHRSDESQNKMTIGNYQLLESLISADLKAKQDQMNRPDTIYLISLAADAGTAFLEGEEKTVTITAQVTRNGHDISSEISSSDLLWQKIDNDGEHDILWETNNSKSTLSVTVTASDINEISSVRCILTKYDNHFVQAIYFLSGLRDVARKVLRLIGPETVVSAHISDTHYATDSIVRDDLENYGRSNSHIKNVAELSHMIDIDYIVLNGDVHDGGTANKDIAKSNYREAISSLSMAGCPYFISWGNHCSNSMGDGRTNSITKLFKNYMPKEPMSGLHGKGKVMLTNAEMYEIATRPSTIFPIVENPDDKMGYYYYDVPGKKMRVIILNPQDIPDRLDTDGYVEYCAINVAGYRQQQINWLYKTLLDTPEDVTVAIYQHFGFGERYATGRAYLPYNYEMVDGILNSFVTGLAYSSSYSDNPDFKASISVDFEGRMGKLAFLAHGHYHTDRIKIDENGIVDYSIGCSVSRPKKDQADRPLGVLEEDLWDVVVLNTKTKHVDLIRFGKGSDRSFDY